MPAPDSWSLDVLLADGQPMHIRPITPADAGFAAEYFSRFSPESVYFRFFSPKQRLTGGEIDHLSTADHEDVVILVGTVDDTIVGGARFDRLEDGSTAEVAFSVVDEYQGRGVASALLERLVLAGRDRGITRFVAEVLPENRKMLQVFRDSGYEVGSTFTDGVIHLSFPIAPTPAAEAAAWERHIGARRAQGRPRTETRHDDDGES